MFTIEVTKVGFEDEPTLVGVYSERKCAEEVAAHFFDKETDVRGTRILEIQQITLLAYRNWKRLQEAMVA